MESCDVLIVGGGPAGSTCAWKLRQAGLDVLVMDKASFPRDKTCAGWITPDVLEALELDAADYVGAGQRVCQPITGFRLGVIGRRSSLVRYAEPVSFGILRRQFDHYLLQRSGARLRLGEPWRGARRDGETWLVNDTIRAPMLVGAGGHFCPVARMLGGGRGEPVVAAQELEFALTDSQQRQCAVDARTPELYFSADLAGYAWCFRKGDMLNIGIGRQDSRRLPEHMADFRQWMIQQRRLPADTPDHAHGHAYLLYGQGARPRLDDAVLLIGDAAGLAYPHSGEGIAPAVESALLAARTILAAQGDFRRARLQSYPNALAERFGASTASQDQPRHATVLLQAITPHLLSLPWFARHIVLDRWFLRRFEPRLARA